MGSRTQQHRSRDLTGRTVDLDHDALRAVVSYDMRGRLAGDQ